MSITTEHQHPLLRSATIIEAALDEVAGVEPVFMTTTDKATALVRLARTRARLAELELRVLAAADDVADRDGARDAGVWLAHHTQAEPATTHGDLRLATEASRV